VALGVEVGEGELEEVVVGLTLGEAPWDTVPVVEGVLVGVLVGVWEGVGLALAV
jgi:hypothetical protein